MVKRCQKKDPELPAKVPGTAFPLKRDEKEKEHKRARPDVNRPGRRRAARAGYASIYFFISP